MAFGKNPKKNCRYLTRKNPRRSTTGKETLWCLTSLAAPMPSVMPSAKSSVINLRFMPPPFHAWEVPLPHDALSGGRI